MSVNNIIIDNKEVKSIKINNQTFYEKLQLLITKITGHFSNGYEITSFNYGGSPLYGVRMYANMSEIKLGQKITSIITFENEIYSYTFDGEAASVDSQNMSLSRFENSEGVSLYDTICTLLPGDYSLKCTYDIIGGGLQHNGISIHS